MKKFVTAFLFVCSCAFVGAAVACKDTTEAPASSEGSIYDRTITFEEGEGYSFVANVEDGGTLPEGTQLIFEVELGGFYTGTPLAYVNGEQIAPDAEGFFAYTVGEEDLTITASGVRKDVSNMVGAGTMDNAFVITKPIDLVYIAEQVNAGNESYCTGAYIVANDIDCKGEELKIIGDYSTQSSIFCGVFTGNDGATTEMEHRTISNFTINSESSNYVGLFGAVFGDPTVESSAYFNCITLDNFTVNAGVSQMTDDNKTICAGSLIGYSVGAIVEFCNASNGDINIISDYNYFSHAGGLIGYQQGFFDPTYGYNYPTEISYVTVDVDVNVLGGVGLTAGGIVGYTATNYAYGASVSIHNSYALGSVNGALRCGGIVGGLGQYSAISNCYAAGEIAARSYQPSDSPLITSDTYSHAYAGGIVGYAENDTVAHDSFFQGSVYVTTASSSKYEHVGTAIAGGDPAGTASVNGQKYLALDCLSNVNLSSPSQLYSIGWEDYNWIFNAGELPTINYETSSETVQLSMTFRFVMPSRTGADKSVLVAGAKEWSTNYFDTVANSSATYAALGSFVLGNDSVPMLTARRQTDTDGFLSYGYFFDEACTLQVPAAYFPEKDIVLYIGFADQNEVVGNYYAATSQSTKEIKIELLADGTATYTDGNTQRTTNYYYDGVNVLLEDARLARYYDGSITLDESDNADTSVVSDANFDLYRYSGYSFMGKKVNGALHFYDGTFFTESAPLVCEKTLFRGEYYKKNANDVTYYSFYGNVATVEIVPTSGASSQKQYDVTYDGTTITLRSGAELIRLTESELNKFHDYKGTWVKSATVDKQYVFDGMGGWKYIQLSYERTLYDCTQNREAYAEGTYEIVGGRLRFTHDGVSYEASFKDGFLEIVGGGSTQTYYAQHSYVGTWLGSSYELSLSGIRQEGYGFATLTTLSDGYATKLIYEVAERINGSNATVLALYYAASGATPIKEAFYGYLTYDLTSNVMQFVLPSEESESGYATDYLYVYDDYHGDWICEFEDFENVEFNGLGLYPYLHSSRLTGKVILMKNGEESESITYLLTSALEGSFSYEGTNYQIRFLEDENRVSITRVEAGTAGTTVETLRKDALGSQDFVTRDGQEYVFDGRSTLGDGKGKLTTPNGTVYTYSKDSEDKFLINDNQGGYIQKKDGDNFYTLYLNGSTTELYLDNAFRGDWAISQEFALFKIGPTDTEGVIKATYKGIEVELTYLNATTLTFKYRDGKMPYTYYVFVIYDDVTNENILVLSEFSILGQGDYFVCTKASGLYGSWVRADGLTMKFDGVSSSYANGTAQLILKHGYMEVVTDYYFTVQKRGETQDMLMWTQEPLAEETYYFRLDFIPAAQATEDDFIMAGNSYALRRTHVDGLCFSSSTDENGVKYMFNGENVDKNKGKMLLLIGDELGAAKYEYEIISYNLDLTVSLLVTDIATGIRYNATLDYSDRSDMRFAIDTDSFYLVEAYGAGDVEYIFNGGNVKGEQGKILLKEPGVEFASLSAAYTYEIVSDDQTNKVATLVVTDTKTNVSYHASLNYSDEKHVVFTLGAQL